MAHTVLIVDDSRLARIVAAKIIRQLKPDWEIVEAANASDAQAAMSRQAIDVALIDFNMPGQDGLQLAQEFRSSHPELPIAVVTANIQDEVVARARAVNAAFVAKPLTEEGLSGFLSGAALRLRKRAS
ncbi:response regulator transcription factor [Enterovirga sp. CN4-39]|uniref:response regulator transcription factor n=1 Tax=Enterovirga sp. CN4-39 TaxID=3400910 RepID=UPI003BFD0B16